MTWRIGQKAPITPGSTVRVVHIARRFCRPLPAIGEWTVKEMRLRADGWHVVLEEFPDTDYPEPAFHVVKLAELGAEVGIPGFGEEMRRLSARSPMPPGYHHLTPEDRRALFG